MCIPVEQLLGMYVVNEKQKEKRNQKLTRNAWEPAYWKITRNA